MEYNKKKLDINIDDLPYKDVLTSRYSMTVRVGVEKTYDYSKKNNLSFFNLSLACILEGLNDIPEFKRRIIDNNVYEFEKINGITPILQKDNSIKELEIEPLSNYDSIKSWNDNIQKKKVNIDKYQYDLDFLLRDEEPIANLSCIPWIDFDSMTNMIVSPNQIMPIISWGKLVNGRIPVSLTASHIFIFGYHFKLFYENIEKYFQYPELILNK